MKKCVAVGECMLELSELCDGIGWRLAHAGDTFNTTLYLRRLGVDAAYLTALGSDRFSAEMLQSWREEGIDTSLVLTAPDRLPGLHAISTDAHGERSFFYWRENSAARQLFALEGIEAALDIAPALTSFTFRALRFRCSMKPGARDLRRLPGMCGRKAGRLPLIPTTGLVAGTGASKLVPPSTPLRDM